jgi:cyclophilin family peptidyl-prolyl cis-trans isomerase
VKQLLVAVLLVAGVACSQRGTDSTAQSDTGTTDTMATASSTTMSSTTAADTAASATDSAATSTAAAGQENASMSNYENKVAELHTSSGEIDIRFFPDVAPNHVKNFIDLANKGFYNGTKFHRVIPGFMIQGGDPNTKAGDPSTWGVGGSGSNVKAEFNTVSHKRGIVSMARAQHPDSASSQFFIVVADSPFLDRQYTVFGQVTKGMDVADKIVSAARGANDRPNNPTSIDRVVIRDARDDEKGPAPQQ